MNPSCTKHIMLRLASRNRVLYVNPFSSDIAGGIRSGMGRRIRRKLLSALRCLRQALPSLHTFTPLFLPVQGNGKTDSINNSAIAAQLRCVCHLLKFSPSLLWLENPRAAPALDWFPRIPSVYHVSDAFVECPYTHDRQALVGRESVLTEKADLLICVSESLWQEKARVRGNAAVYMPHGVDVERFQAANAGGRTSGLLAGIPRPIAGYFGTLTAQNDIPLLEFCAKNAPDVSYVLAGAVTAGDYSALRRLPNVYFLGQVPYEQVAELAAGFDVCLMPWRMTAWIRHCSPLKFLEYMASGKPIVSVPIPQVERMGGELVSIAAGPASFLERIRWELSHDTPSRAARRQALAQAHSWDRHSALLCERLAALVNQHG